jgi:hypothetical protein
MAVMCVWLFGFLAKDPTRKLNITIVIIPKTQIASKEPPEDFNCWAAVAI